MRSSNTLMPVLAGGLLVAGGLMVAAVPKPEPHDVQSIAPIWNDERPGEASAAALGFEIAWFTIDAGGGTSIGSGGFELSGTIGQPDAGNASGNAFDLSGGYWTAVVAVPTPTCTGDLNGDNVVDVGDLGILLNDFGCMGMGCVGDINGDGLVDVTDLSIMLNVFGNLCK